MPLICTCPHGHRWQHSEPAPPAGAPPLLCPVCGTAATTVVPEVFPEQGETATFPPPLRPRSAPEPPVLSLEEAREAIARPKSAHTVVPTVAPTSVGPPVVPEGRPHARFPERPAYAPAPPQRSATGPVLLAVAGTTVILLLLGGLLVFFWFGPAGNEAREEAEAARHAAERARTQAEQAREIEAKNGAAARREALQERTRRELAEQGATQLQQQLEEERRRLREAEATARQADERTSQALKGAAARHQKELLALRQKTAATVYDYQITLADWELRARAPDRAESYLQGCAAPLRRWEWHYLHRLASAEVLTCTLHTDLVGGVAFAPDGKRIASAGKDRLVKVWDAATGKDLLTCRSHHPVHAVAFSSDGKRLASCGGDLGKPGELKVWNAADAKELLDLKGHSDLVYAVAFSPAGDRLASAGWDGTVRVWDASSGKELLVFKGHKKRVHGVAFSPDGKQVASCGDGEAKGAGGEVKLWDADTGKEAVTFRGHRGAALAVTFHPDGKRLASAGADAVIRVWDAAARGDGAAPLFALQASKAGVRGLALDAGKSLFAAGTDGVVRVWDLEKRLWVRALRGHLGAVLAVAVSPDGARVVSGGADKTARVWDVAPMPEFRSLPAHDGTVTAIAFAPDGYRLATAGADKVVKLWDVRAGAAPLLLEGFARPVTLLAFSPNGKRLVTVGSPSEQGDRAVEVKVWDAGTGKPILTVPGQAGGLVSAGFGRDSNRLLLAAPGATLKIVDVATGKEAARLDGAPGAPQAGTAVDYLAVSSDGNRLALAWQNGITIVTRSAAGEWQKRELAEHTHPVAGLAWGAVGNLLAVDMGGNKVKVWNVLTGKSPGVWVGPRVDVHGVALSPDGTRLVTAGPVRSAMLWDMGARRLLLPLRGPAAAATGVTFSPDGRRLAAGMVNGSVVIWDASPRKAAVGP